MSCSRRCSTSKRTKSRADSRRGLSTSTRLELALAGLGQRLRARPPLRTRMRLVRGRGELTWEGLAWLRDILDQRGHALRTVAFAVLMLVTVQLGQVWHVARRRRRRSRNLDVRCGLLPVVTCPGHHRSRARERRCEAGRSGGQASPIGGGRSCGTRRLQRGPCPRVPWAPPPRVAMHWSSRLPLVGSRANCVSSSPPARSGVSSPRHPPTCCTPGTRARRRRSVTPSLHTSTISHRSCSWRPRCVASPERSSRDEWPDVPERCSAQKRGPGHSSTCPLKRRTPSCTRFQAPRGCVPSSASWPRWCRYGAGYSAVSRCLRCPC